MQVHYGLQFLETGYLLSKCTRWKLYIYYLGSKIYILINQKDKMKV